MRGAQATYPCASLAEPCKLHAVGLVLVENSERWDRRCDAAQAAPRAGKPTAGRRRAAPACSGIEEMPAGYDAEVAELFRDLRAASALSEADLAARLGTRADVVQALEQGALYALPPWAETCRVVNAYGALLNLDVRPLLRRIYAQLEAGIVELRPKAMPDVPVMMPPDNSDFAFRPGTQAAPSGRSPLDIEWTPDPVPARPQSPPPPQPAQKPQAPQAPWQNASPVPQARPRGPSAPAPQAPWAGGAPQRPAGPAPQQAERRPEQRPPQAPQGQPAQGRPPQGQAPQGQVPQGQPLQRPAQPQAREPAPPRPPTPRAEFAPPPPTPPPAAPSAAIPIAEPAAIEERPKRKSALLKWGVIVLLIAIMAFGAWLVLHSMTGPSSVKSPTTGSQPLDPDDPRSRKADKLQGPS